MAIMDRIFGGKQEKAKEVEVASVPSAPSPVSWSLVVHTGGDVCISVGQLPGPVSSVSVVFNLEFHDEARGASPLRLVATHPDGTATTLDLASIDGLPGRETAQIEAMARVVKAPSILLCETDDVGITSMHHAPVHIDEVDDAPSPRQPTPDARTHEVTVMNVLAPGDAHDEWKGLVRLHAGEFDVGEAFMTLYPAPMLEQGMRTTVVGTFRTDGGRASMQTCTDAVMTESVRLHGFTRPFHLEMELGGLGDEGRLAARMILTNTITAMASAGCKAHAYMEGTLVPYVRMLGNRYDHGAAEKLGRLAVRIEDTPSEDFHGNRQPEL